MGGQLPQAVELSNNLAVPHTSKVWGRHISRNNKITFYDKYFHQISSKQGLRDSSLIPSSTLHLNKMANIEAPPKSRKMHDLTDQIVLITGIGCIGEGWSNGLTIATLFARQGATIFGCDISPEAAQQAKTRILSDSPNADITVMQTDVTSSPDVKKFVNACMEKHGRIDILINNVGRSEPGDPGTLSEEMWDQQIELNLKSIYLTTHHVLPIMVSQHQNSPPGKKPNHSIVNISSVAALRYIGKPQVAYSTAKGAIRSFTRTTAVIYAAKGVRVNCVVPGLMDTPLVKTLAEKYAGEDYEGYRKVREGQVPMGRMGSAWDVAGAVLYLVSWEAGYVTGTEIIVDGGLVGSTGRL
ncbi:hypothetical protein HYFRA_00004331 [Hymenoscyphus fraxineus]|uniref:NAD(P)-binding protein n=1 Tax=Hymenoscyphus fraxineus TaxID=746836 RepID=A0A9N9KN34_9HELO|nr:hypothetical protein HYFRA_00004331 [Hymenoscyphus fraxineus]